MANTTDVTGGLFNSLGGGGAAALGPMGPLVAGAGLVAGGILDFMGTEQEMKAASQVSQDSAAIAGLEEQINQVKQTQMHVTTQRQEMENLRNTQRAIATGRAAATNQGAQFGSGIAGARGGDVAKGAFNTLGLVQNEMLGDQVFGLTSSIDQYKQKIALAQGSEAQGAGMASLGQGIMGGALNIGKLFPV